MALVSFFVLLASACLASTATVSQSADPVIEGTELVFAFMTHRHGDRTPAVGTSSVLGLDNSKIETLIAPWGYGQLTDAGKRTGYKIGQFIRRRYNDLIAAKYNKSEMYVRSTDSTRTKMTVLTALSAVYPVGKDSWSDDINWEPIPYTTVPARYDFNQATLNCPTFADSYAGVIMVPNPRMDPYTDLIEKISEISGTDIRSIPLLISLYHDLYASINSLGYDIGDDIRELMPLIAEAAGVAWDILTGNENYLPLQAGVFLNEFFTYANEIIAGEDTQKVRIYSAHDLNVYSLLAIARAVPRQGAPNYGSLFSLELRRVVASGQYVVLPVYLDDPHVGVEKYLQVDGCGDSFLCEYQTFFNLTATSLRDINSWRTECGFDENTDVDSSGVD